MLLVVRGLSRILKMYHYDLDVIILNIKFWSIYINHLNSIYKN